MRTWFRGLLDRVSSFSRYVVASARANPILALTALVVAVPCAMLFAIQVRSLWATIYGIHDWRKGWTY